MRIAKIAFKTVLLVFLGYYCAALWLPYKDVLLPQFGVVAYGPGTSYKYPLIPQEPTISSPVRVIMPLKPGQAVPVASGETDAEKELQRLTKYKINVAFTPAPCGMVLAESQTAGCVLPNQPFTIYFSDGVRKLTGVEAKSMAAHELGHVYQRRVDRNFLTTDSVVVAAFPATDAPEEQLADCMAQVKTGETTGVYIEDCDSTQLAIAQEVWDGIKP